MMVEDIDENIFNFEVITVHGNGLALFIMKYFSLVCCCSLP